MALGGDITVQSELGTGSCFSLTIDVGDLSGTEMLASPPSGGSGGSQQATSAVRAANENINLSGVRILLAEDGLVNQKLIAALLTQAGADSVDLAENGSIAIRKTEACDYDVILMDMQMPVLDGYAAAHILRESGNRTPIIALTAHAMKGDREQCLQAGCTDYVTKPIDAEELIHSVASCVRPGLDLATESERKITAAGQSSGKANVISSTLPIENPVFREIVRDFGQLLNGLLPQMHDAARGRRSDVLSRLTHDLIGTAGSAGFGEFTGPGRQLEEFIKAGQHDEIMQSLRLLDELAMRVDIPADEAAVTA